MGGEGSDCDAQYKPFFFFAVTSSVILIVVFILTSH